MKGYMKRCESERTQSKFIQKWKYKKLMLICQSSLEEQQAKVCLYQDIKTDTQDKIKILCMRKTIRIW